jgi:hypothetical protein
VENAAYGLGYDGPVWQQDAGKKTGGCFERVVMIRGVTIRGITNPHPFSSNVFFLPL